MWVSFGSDVTNDKAHCRITEGAFGDGLEESRLADVCEANLKC